jgi:hypothetical protein
MRVLGDILIKPYYGLDYVGCRLDSKVKAMVWTLVRCRLDWSCLMRFRWDMSLQAHTLNHAMVWSFTA